MIKNIVRLLVVLILLVQNLQAQNVIQKRPVDFSVWDGWKNIENQSISNDGKWVSYEINPYKGDGKLVIMNPDKLNKIEFNRGTKAAFSPGSKYIAFKIEPQTDSIRKLKFQKAKKENFPKDSLFVYILKKNESLIFENLKSFQLPVEESDWMAFQQEIKDEKGENKPVKKPKYAPDVFDLTILNPISNKSYHFKDVSEYTFSRNGKLLGFIQLNYNNPLSSKVSIFDTEKEDLIKIFDNQGLTKKLTVDDEGKQSAFIFTSDSVDIKIYDLFYWSKSMPNISEKIVGDNFQGLPKDWIVSEYGDIWFSGNGSKLYFGTAIKQETPIKDTLLDEEKIGVDLWSWTDPLLQSQQLIELKKELIRNYLTVYHTDKKQVARLADEFIKETPTIQNGDGNIAMGIADSPFQRERSWSYPWFKDVYLVDVNTGNKKIVLEKTSSFVELSPFGNYLFWFENQDKCWYTINTKTKEKKCLTGKIPFNFYDEEYDRPSVPPPYMFAGWTDKDKYFLVYDRYDIWKIDPNGKENPVCLTNGFGRKNNIELRFFNLNRKQRYIDPEQNMILSAFNKTNKQSGYYSCMVNRPADPIKLVMGDFDYADLIKSENAKAVIWKRNSVKEFPDLWYSGNFFTDPMKISYANPQQENYIWQSVELVKWTTFDGKEEEGLLYKPEDFDPNKKYPMMVTFYELRSDKLHTHYYPRPSRSAINILEYTSNGYLVFVPNIRYKIGNPGESAVNYVVSGTKAMINNGYVDQSRIGMQGQSWGAYQVAYIITQTDLFRAASAAAPVSNMTSAYGNIYWQLGISRMSMYESDQSRIGASLWEKPELYIQNSPIFYADKIETPLLIVHNDADGAVPWNQGIELFVALRRLNKPVWLLNYNGEPHNLRDKSPNNKDLSIRMFQFFNHYLKSEPEPVWLKNGIPALKKGKELGYEIENDIN
jgi:dipeptidyl aminopeptidase/acylaminoacyl peptidase